jgi:hypothetical protein
MWRFRSASILRRPRPNRPHLRPHLRRPPGPNRPPNYRRSTSNPPAPQKDPSANRGGTKTARENGRRAKGRRATDRIAIVRRAASPIAAANPTATANPIETGRAPNIASRRPLPNRSMSFSRISKVSI